MFVRIRILLLLVLLFNTNNLLAAPISSSSKMLAWCEGVYIYYANYMQIRNNEGATKNLLFRASRVVSANMFMNIENDVISGEKIAQFKEVRKDMKARFDADPEGNAVEIDKCDYAVINIIADVKNKKIVWKGLDLHGFQILMLETYLETLGIK